MIKYFTVFLFLTGCVAATGSAGNQSSTDVSVVPASTPAGVDRQAYKAHRVAESVEAFAAVCLKPGLTVNRAAAAAREQKAGLTAPTQYWSEGRPAVRIVARRDGDGIQDRDELFEWYRCTVEFRGTWADIVLPMIMARLSEEGFRINSSFERRSITPAQAYDQSEAVMYTGTVSRNGQAFALTIAHSPSGADVNFRYISGTSIEIETK